MPEVCPNDQIIRTSLMAAPHEGKGAEMIPPPANNCGYEAPQQLGDWSKWINMGGI